MGSIAASWVISPVLGAIFAAGFLYLVKRSITYQEDMVAAAVRMVPILVGVMAALWFVAALVLQAARCGGAERMMLASQGIIGIAACVFAADHGEMMRFRDGGRR